MDILIVLSAFNNTENHTVKEVQVNIIILLIFQIPVRLLNPSQFTNGSIRRLMSTSLMTFSEEHNLVAYELISVVYRWSLHRQHAYIIYDGNDGGRRLQENVYKCKSMWREVDKQEANHVFADGPAQSHHSAVCRNEGGLQAEPRHDITVTPGLPLYILFSFFSWCYLSVPTPTPLPLSLFHYLYKHLWWF